MLNNPSFHIDPRGLQESSPYDPLSPPAGTSEANYENALRQMGLGDRFLRLSRTIRGRAQLGLEALCGCASLTCSQAECMAESAEIANAYVDAYYKERSWSIPRIVVRDDYRAGRLCYQWQTITFNAVKSIVRKGKCFEIDRVGSVTANGTSTTLQHNWIAISAEKQGDNGQETRRAPIGKCTAYLDPWWAASPAVYNYTGAGYERGHWSHNFLGYGNDTGTPAGMSGYYYPPSGLPQLKDYQW